jgi:hypothetical protein
MAALQRIRRVKNENFTTINNAVLRDTSLSLKAKGLMVMVMGLPETWDFSIAGLAKIVKEGKDSLYAAIDELERSGYVTKARRHNEKGQFMGVEYTFWEQRQFVNSPFRDFPYTDSPDTAKPDTDNPTQLKKEGIKERGKRRNTRLKKENSVCAPVTEAEQEIIDAFKVWFPETPLSSALSTLILSSVSDLSAWINTVQYWALNGYKPGRKMIQYYEEEVSGGQAAHWDHFRTYQPSSF